MTFMSSKGAFMRAKGMISSAGGGYVANAVDFDGSNDYLNRSELVGSADGKECTGSVWFRLDGGDGNQLILFHIGTAAADRALVYKNSSDIITVTWKTPANVIKANMTSTSTFTASSTWHHLLWSFDLANTKGDLYIDDVNEKDTSSFVDSDVEFTNTHNAIGTRRAGLEKWNGCLSEFYIAAEYIDISVASNRALFSSGSKPVSLGPTGATPSGNQPLIYLNGDATNFEINQGSGGDFTVTGSLDNCDTGPSD